MNKPLSPTYKIAAVTVFLAILFMLALPTRSAAYQQTDFSSINLNQTSEELEAKLGQPQKQTQEQDFTTLWYDSTAPNHAHHFYFRHNQLKLKSIEVFDEHLTLETLIHQIGWPEKSVPQYTPGADFLRRIQHFWPQESLAVTTYGNEIISPIARIYEYDSTDPTIVTTVFGENFDTKGQTFIDGYPSEHYSPQDLNHDCLVDILDYSALVGSFLYQGWGISSDFNADKIVDILDYSQLVKNFLSTCHEHSPTP